MNSKLFQAALAFALLISIQLTSQACTLPVEAVITGPAWDPHWLHVGYEECFNGSDSRPIGGIDSWQWDFGDGSDPDSNTGRPPDCDGDGYEVRHEYSTVGTYYPSLRVEGFNQDEHTKSFTLYVVNWGIGIGSGNYTNKVAVNNDDDNENGTMDKKYPDEQELDNEDDLVPIVLSASTDKSSDKILLAVESGMSHIKIWKWQDKRDLQIPDPQNNNENYKEYSTGSCPLTLYVEGIEQSAFEAVELEMYYIAVPPVGPERYVVRDPDDPHALLKFTVLEVDMDMDDVPDDDSQETTCEIIPGGFVGVGDRVRVELKKVEPTTLTGNVTLDVIAGGSKIEVQDEQGNPISLPKTYATPDDLLEPEPVWVKGIDTSSSLRDVTLELAYGMFHDRINMTVYSVDSVVWEEYPGNDDLGECPNNGGKRMFPGTYTFNEDVETAAERRKVRAMATTTPIVDHKKVYFQWWDVDDDNNGTGSAFGAGFDGGAVTKNAFTNASGEARLTFTVSVCPGDNFRISAAPSESKRDEMDQTMADNGTPPDHVALTEMLTVWRKLWIERDSMDQVAVSGSEKNLIAGDAVGYTQINSTQDKVDLGEDLEFHLDFCWNDQFEDGLYAVAGHAPYPVVSNYFSHEVQPPPGWDIHELTVDGHPSSDGVGLYYNLFDDDWEGFNDPKVTLPTYPTLGSYADEYRKAYIEPTYLGSEYSDVISFDRHLSHFLVSYSQGAWNNTRHCSPSSWNFWTVFVLSAFQPGRDWDCDPDTESGINAQASLVSNECALYLEVIRECSDEDEIMAHEIGHTGGLAHCGNTGCIMESEENVGYKFCDECLAELRDTIAW